MKKLFFTALVAVAAIGGAYAAQYEGETSGDIYNCPDTSGPLCIDIPENIRVKDSGNEFQSPASFGFTSEQYTIL